MANNRRRLQGRVVSNKMEKTVSVLIERRTMHRVYSKVMTTSRKVMAHDESNEIPMGAIVRLVESKPLSKRKRWVVEEVLETPEQVIPVAEAVADVTVTPDDAPAEAEESAEE